MNDWLYEPKPIMIYLFLQRLYWPLQMNFDICLASSMNITNKKNFAMNAMEKPLTPPWNRFLSFSTKIEMPNPLYLKLSPILQNLWNGKENKKTSFLGPGQKNGGVQKKFAFPHPF